jgi:hypothetical protein
MVILQYDLGVAGAFVSADALAIKSATANNKTNLFAILI